MPLFTELDLTARNATAFVMDQNRAIVQVSLIVASFLLGYLPEIGKFLRYIPVLSCISQILTQYTGHCTHPWAIQERGIYTLLTAPDSSV